MSMSYTSRSFIQTSLASLNPSICGKRFFITFIDDFSRYDYLYFIKEKCEALEKFKNFNTKVEKQLGKMFMILRSNHGGEC
ncbi:hypothetical protein CR513_54231, partial [Mucuna pruriens]